MRTHYVDPYPQVQSRAGFLPLVLLSPYSMWVTRQCCQRLQGVWGWRGRILKRAVPTCHLSQAQVLSSFFLCLERIQSRSSGNSMAAVFKEPPSASADCLYDAGLVSQVLLPSDPDYAGREDSYWCNDAKLGPACIVRPRSAEDVSTALKALVSAGHEFAVRSGGHTNWAGANNITNGVTVFQPVPPY